VAVLGGGAISHARGVPVHELHGGVARRVYDDPFWNPEADGRLAGGVQSSHSISPPPSPRMIFRPVCPGVVKKRGLETGTEATGVPRS
jgi:hypothetical protein